MQFLPQPDSTWLRTLQSLLHYYLPPIEKSPQTVGGCLGATVLGLVLAFRSAMIAQWLVALVGAGVGALAGYRVAELIQTPGPISAAVGGLLAGVLAYRTHRWWLAGGSVVALVGAAFVYQLAANGDLARLVPDANGAAGTAQSAPRVRLATPAEQLNNLYPRQREQIAKLWSQVVNQMKAWSARGWVVPVVGLIAGVILAWWALRVIAVVWIALVGALLAVGGGTGLVLLLSPETQKEVVRRPDFVLAVAAGIWILGLVWQAKAARFGRTVGKAKPAAKANSQA